MPDRSQIELEILDLWLRYVVDFENKVWSDPFPGRWGDVYAVVYDDLFVLACQ